MRKAKLAFMGVLLALLTAGVAVAAGAGYDIGRWVVSSGGGERASGQYRVQDVTAEAAGGASQSEGYLLGAGFFAGAGAPAPVPDWDVNMDGCTSLADLVLVGQRWGQTGDAGWIREDVSGDGRISLGDLVLIGQHWREGCED